MTWIATLWHVFKIVLGDFNTKLGRLSCFLPVIDKQNLHCEASGNGIKHTDFAVGKNMVISSTYFPYNDIHKATWKSSDSVTENQIDHVVIDKRHVKDILDVKLYRGANMDSDH